MCCSPTRGAAATQQRASVSCYGASPYSNCCSNSQVCAKPCGSRPRASSLWLATPTSCPTILASSSRMPSGHPYFPPSGSSIQLSPPSAALSCGRNSWKGNGRERCVPTIRLSGTLAQADGKGSLWQQPSPTLSPPALLAKPNKPRLSCAGSFPGSAACASTPPCSSTCRRPSA